MIRYERNETVDLDKYENALKQHGCFIRYSWDKLSWSQQTMIGESAVYELMALDKMRHHSGCTCIFLGRESVHRYLTRFERCPEHYFENKHVQGISVDMKRCLIPLMENNYAKEFLEYYTTFKSLSAKSSKLKKILSQCRDNSAVTEDGTALSKIPFNVKREANFRFNYSQFDIITQIPKAESSCVGVEDGYVLAWGDFAQSDLRIVYNIFLRSKENDKIMMQYEDKYEGLARIINLRLNEPFDKEKFTKERKLYKRLALATIYGTDSSVIKEESKFIERLNKFLDTCPRYVEYRNRLRLSHKLKLPVEIESYFGNVETSPNMYSEKDTINRALNAPIQKGTSEIVILTVCKILDMFYSLGYTEDDVCIYYVRHDEPIFKIRKEVMKDSWVLKQFETIFVGSWMPLRLEFEFGYWYNVPDEKLNEQYTTVCAKNIDKIDVVEASAAEEEDFFPVKKVLVLRVYSKKIPECKSTVISFYDTERNLVQYTLAETMNDEEVWTVIVDRVRKIKLGKDYRGVLVENRFADHECYVDGKYIQFKRTSGTEYYRVYVLTKFMVNKYCKMIGIDSPVDPLLKSESEIVESVGELSEL